MLTKKEKGQMITVGAVAVVAAIVEALFAAEVYTGMDGDVIPFFRAPEGVEVPDMHDGTRKVFTGVFGLMAIFTAIMAPVLIRKGVRG